MKKNTQWHRFRTMPQINFKLMGWCYALTLLVGMPTMAQVALSSDRLVNNNNGATATGNFLQSETTIIAYDSNLVIGFNDGGSFSFGMHGTGWAYSSNGGHSFTDAGQLPAAPLGDLVDPSMARDNTTGRIYYAMVTFSGQDRRQIHMWRSDNNGVSWMAPVHATPGGNHEDKEWVTVDNFQGTGNGNVYLLSVRTGIGPGIYFFRSTDNGDSFGPNGGTLIAAGSAGSVDAHGPFIILGTNHEIYAFWWAGTTIKMRRSIDFGNSFEAPITVVSGLKGISSNYGDLNLTGIRQGTTTPAYFFTNSFAHVAVNPVSGNLYVTFPDNPDGPDKADIFYVQSVDDGATWSTPIRVNDDATTTDQWLPTIAVTPDGNHLGIFYYSRQEDPANNNLYKYYGRISSISGAGVTFSPGFAISDVASFPEFGRGGGFAPVYHGDYNRAVSTPGTFHVVWSDDRDDLNIPGSAPRKDPNVYYEAVCVPGALRCTASAQSDVIYLGYGPQSSQLQTTVNLPGTYSYKWTSATGLNNATVSNPVFTPSAPGIYTFEVEATSVWGCKATSSVTICISDIRVANSNDKLYICHAPPDNPNHKKTIAISTNAVSDHLSHGDKLGKCEQQPSCNINASNEMITIDPARESPVQTKKGFITYPNPNDGCFNLQLDYSGGSVEIRVLNIAGVVVARKRIEVTGKGSIIPFNIRNIGAGLYYIQVVTKEGISSSKLIITN